jgi:hypothetical protein
MATNGMRLTELATNIPTGRLADLELRHRARGEGRIRAAIYGLPA